MSLEELKLTYVGEGLEYRITNLQNVDLTSRKESLSIAPPGLSSRENILLGVSGMQADISIQFQIHDDGTDKADGSAGSSIQSIQEQIRYLEDDMQAPEFDAAWTLDHIDGAAFNGDEVFFERLRVPVIDQESPKWREATIDLRRGGSV